jgi:hypothetical protein
VATGVIVLAGRVVEAWTAGMGSATQIAALTIKADAIIVARASGSQIDSRRDAPAVSAVSVADSCAISAPFHSAAFGPREFSKTIRYPRVDVYW